jgi:hypothetical protein
MHMFIASDLPELHFGKFERNKALKKESSGRNLPESDKVY